MNVRVFYSWQSDTPAKTNRGFIQKAIEIAITRINKSDLDLDFVLDRDTKEVAGTPSIADTILEKIENCDIFIGDLTYDAKNTIGEPCPNPNVLLELGFAVGRKGWDCVINVMNEHYGSADSLPFDLKHRRWPIRYTLEPNIQDDSKSKTLSYLGKQIEEAITMVLETGVLVKQASYAERLRQTELDRELYQRINTILNESGCIHFLHHHDFQNSFNASYLDYLMDYVSLCESADFVFYDEKAKQLNSDLKERVESFLLYSSINTFPHPYNYLKQTIALDPYSEKDFFLYAGDTENSREELIRERLKQRNIAANELNKLSSEVADCYRGFAKYTRSV